MRSLCALALGCGLYGACLEPPILPPLPEHAGAAGEAWGGAGGGELADGGDAGGAGAPATSGAGGLSAAGSSPQAGGGGSAGSGGSAGYGPGVTWLEIDESDAPDSSAVNASLGIQGHFYAYADDCASLTWDPATRCASGSLCQPGLDYENWGVAVGFDFNSTGNDGDPPSTKRLWDPRDYGVVGFAWRIRGMAPALQVWVLNMDPSFGLACGVATCEIPGPPDGDDAAALTGQLLLSQLRKDDWGGAGEYYEFDPARVHALQIKLPALLAGGQRFSFCVDALGVVR